MPPYFYLMNLLYCSLYLTYRKAKLTISKNASYNAKITVMPDYGRMWLWINLVAPLQTSRLEGADYEHAIIESISAALDADLADWQAEFEVCTNDAKTGAAWLDWPAFHQRGLALARRLRAELSDDIGVYYQKPFEDPNEQFEETKELLRDGVITLPAQARRLRSGRQVPDWLPAQILSGGQTGVSRAALDWAITERIPHCGWCPKERKAADGELSCRYQLQESDTKSHRLPTEQNVLASDATLIMTAGPLIGASKLTYEFCQQHHKPRYVVNLSDLTIAGAADVIRCWLMGENVRRLNVTGPSESRKQQIYRTAFAVLDALIPLVESEEEV